MLAALYPTGTVAPLVEKRLAELQEEGALVEESSLGILQELIEEIINEYRTNPAFGAMQGGGLKDEK